MRAPPLAERPMEALYRVCGAPTPQLMREPSGRTHSQCRFKTLTKACSSTGISWRAGSTSRHAQRVPVPPSCTFSTTPYSARTATSGSSNPVAMPHACIAPTDQTGRYLLKWRLPNQCMRPPAAPRPLRTLTCRRGLSPQLIRQIVRHTQPLPACTRRYDGSMAYTVPHRRVADACRVWSRCTGSTQRDDL